MPFQTENEIAHFKTGELVRAIGSPQVMKVIECREGMHHIFMEGAKGVHYKCTWTRGDGLTFESWYDACKLERVW